MTNEEKAQRIDRIAAEYCHDGQRETFLALEAGAAALRREQWKPIEDAPKDGRRVQVGWLGITGNIGRYHEHTGLWFDAVNGRPFLPDQPSYYRELAAPPEDMNRDS